MNVGPKADGTLPEEFCARVQEVGAWLKANGEAVYGNDGGNLTEATSYGYQTMRGNTLYVILRFYDGAATFRLADLTSEVKGVRLLSTGEALAFQKSGDDLLISLPESIRQEALFPVLAIECAARPATNTRYTASEKQTVRRMDDGFGRSVITTLIPARQSRSAMPEAMSPAPFIITHSLFPLEMVLDPV